MDEEGKENGFKVCSKAGTLLGKAAPAQGVKI